VGSDELERDDIRRGKHGNERRDWRTKRERDRQRETEREGEVEGKRKRKGIYGTKAEKILLSIRICYMKILPTRITFCPNNCPPGAQRMNRQF